MLNLLALKWHPMALSITDDFPGPITASAILALSTGIGEMAGNGDETAPDSLGIVALAVLYPILFVEMLAVIMSFIVDKDSIESGSGNEEDGNGGGDFMQALLDTAQAAFPLLAFLFVALKLIARKSIPQVSWNDLLEDSEDAHADEHRFRSKAEELQATPATCEDHKSQDSLDLQLEQLAGTDEVLEKALGGHPVMNYQWSINSEEEGGSYLVPFMDRSPERRFRTLWHVFPTIQRPNVHHFADDNSVITDIDGKSVTNLEKFEIPPTMGASDNEESEATGSNLGTKHAHEQNEFNVEVDIEDTEDIGHSASFQQREAPAQTTSFKLRELERLKKGQGWCRNLSPIHLKHWLRRNKFFLIGTTFIPLGLLLLNLGIQFTLTPLGDQVGGKMPALFMKGDEVKEPQIMPRGIGLVVTSAYIFFLGFFATRAEPALLVLAITVEEVTKGDFGRYKLQNSVACGVGVGITVGILQIIFDFSVLYFLIAGYAIALMLVLHASDAVKSVAWDSGYVHVITLVDINITFTSVC